MFYIWVMLFKMQLKYFSRFVKLQDFVLQIFVLECFIWVFLHYVTLVDCA